MIEKIRDGLGDSEIMSEGLVKFDCKVSVKEAEVLIKWLLNRDFSYITYVNLNDYWEYNNRVRYSIMGSWFQYSVDANHEGFQRPSVEFIKKYLEKECTGSLGKFHFRLKGRVVLCEEYPLMQEWFKVFKEAAKQLKQNRLMNLWGNIYSKQVLAEYFPLTFFPLVLNDRDDCHWKSIFEKRIKTEV
jgi:hypothetical protein